MDVEVVIFIAFYLIEVIIDGDKLLNRSILYIATLWGGYTECFISNLYAPSKNKAISPTVSKVSVHLPFLAWQTSEVFEVQTSEVSARGVNNYWLFDEW